MKRIILIVLVLSGLSLAFLTTCKKTDDSTKLTAITIIPADTGMVPGDTIHYLALGLFSNNVIYELTNIVEWSSSAPGIVSISNTPGMKGYAVSHDSGAVNITASYSGISKTASLLVSTSAQLSRSKVLKDYNDIYLATELANCGWTGNVANCEHGDITAEARTKVLKRINYFRVLVGLPGDITLDTVYNRKDQEAALMMKANNQLSHTPPPTWTCYTGDGAEAAGHSNIALGLHSVNAISGYIEDFGSNNLEAGHRRWLLYSEANIMGSGSTDNSDATWVLPTKSQKGPKVNPEFIAYPPSGYVPAPLVFPRWSFAVPGGDFTNAVVTMTDENNDPITLNITSQAATGMGDNTIVWEPDGINTGGPGDIKYKVTVSGVYVLGTPRDYNYSVTIIQPSAKAKSEYEILRNSGKKMYLK